MSAHIFQEICEKALAPEPAEQPDGDMWKRILLRWEVRGVALTSLVLQLILVLYGNRKNCKATSWIPVVVWLAYMLADWVATLGLSHLLHKIRRFRAPCTERDLKFEVRAFWCPFLLLHLGGPDTITSYSLEDNEIWLRHLMGVAFQLSFASYLYINFFSNRNHVSVHQDPLPYVALPIFLAGIIKCADRNWCLRTASEQQWRTSLFSVPAPKPPSQTNPPAGDVEMPSPADLPGSNRIFPKAKRLHQAYFLFNVSRYLIAGVNLKIKNHFGRQFTTIGSANSFSKAFRLIEIEIGFLYDVLYTKVPIIHTHWGRILRVVNLLCSTFALVSFCWVVNNPPYDRIKHSLDVMLTFSMMGAGICLEIYWVIYHVFSNWTLLCLSRNKKNELFISLYKFISSFILNTSTGKREAFYMAQHNLIRLCFHITNAKRFRCLGLFETYHDKVGKYLFTTFEPVDDDLKKSIFTYLQAEYRRYESAKFSYEFLMEVLERRGDYAIQKHLVQRRPRDLSWSTSQLQFDHSILLWHIATDLCYYKELENKNILSAECRRSKLVSDYMFYLLITIPAMLSMGISDLRVRDTRDEAVKVYESKKVVYESSKVEHRSLKACEELLKYSNNEQPKLRNKSSLSDAIKLGKQLMEMGEWELIGDVWIEMLCYAASHCEWKQHAKQLGRGVELLTHVSLLMAHLGFSPNIHFAESINREDIPPHELHLPDNQKNVQHFILSCLA